MCVFINFFVSFMLLFTMTKMLANNMATYKSSISVKGQHFNDAVLLKLHICSFMQQIKQVTLHKRSGEVKQHSKVKWLIICNL